MRQNPLNSFDLMIGRNKHFPYIASFHGSWTSLPSDLFQSLLLINRSSPPRGKGAPATAVARAIAEIEQEGRQPPAPPIDPIVFRNLFAVRKLFDEAVQLIMRANDERIGMPTPYLAGLPTALKNPSAITAGPSCTSGGGGAIKDAVIGSHRLKASQESTATAGKLGFLGGGVEREGIGSVSVLPPFGLSKKSRQERVNEMREMAVSLMASAYRIDEVATSVLAMQSSTALDDVAAKVLKRNPNHLDALYVHHFHEKIPSRIGIHSHTTTEILDRLIDAYPTHPAYYRSRAMIHQFQENYGAAVRDFKTAIAMAKKRRGKQGVGGGGGSSGGNTASSSNTSNNSTFGTAGANAEITAPLTKYFKETGGMNVEAAVGLIREELDRADICERQLFFLRGACCHQYAVYVIDRAIEKFNDGKEAERKDRPFQAPPAPISGPQSYRRSRIMTAPIAETRAAFKQIEEQVHTLARKSIKDYMHFLSSFACGLDVDEFPLGPGGVTSGSNGSCRTGFGRGGSVGAEGGDSDDEKENVVVSREESDVVIRSHHGDSLRSTEGSDHRRDFYEDTPPQRITRTSGESLSAFVQSIPFKILSTMVEPKSGGSDSDEALGVLYLGRTWDGRDATELRAAGYTRGGDPHTTYHPLIVEAWYAIGCNYLILGDWVAAAGWHDRVAAMHVMAEGYPLFLPPRSMSQTDYVEVLRRCRVEADAREALRARMQSDTSSSSNTGTLSSSASPEGGAVVVVKGKSTAPSRVEVTRDPSALGPGGTAKRMTHIMPLYTKRGDVLSMWLRKDMS